MPNVTEAQAQIMGFEETLSRVMVNFDLQDTSLEDETDQLLSDIMDAHPNISPASKLAAVSILRKRLPDTPTNWRSILSRKVDGIEYCRSVPLCLVESRQNILVLATIESFNIQKMCNMTYLLADLLMT